MHCPTFHLQRWSECLLGTQIPVPSMDSFHFPISRVNLNHTDVTGGMHVQGHRSPPHWNKTHLKCRNFPSRNWDVSSEYALHLFARVRVVRLTTTHVKYCKLFLLTCTCSLHLLYASANRFDGRNVNLPNLAVCNYSTSVHLVRSWTEARLVNMTSYSVFRLTIIVFDTLTKTDSSCMNTLVYLWTNRNKH